ncbi:response regulator transcription factor [Pseudomonas protegens]|uniref:response regulator transcription factor n=1 Tax=Pseudomonas protegens TaxID=380021 RepID=UPI000F4A6FD2|nr:response regulator transcription factor [Pseudomonas protegens]ROL94052.1 DNA-binding response regulator [Pseudomonas protegens]ROM00222.1 DNA-binding response regulator [Pseudomonas protegens]ROM03712.1 DNA-binding response regulator [Pseudomonas protegens]ROM11028.1 DNA-binding response regulator [Pseudomonas protegens]
MRNLLLIDDHPMFRMAARMMLERVGHRVVGEAGNGIDGLSQARTLQPDLVTLDLDIPGLGGLEVIARLKALEQPPRILVVTGQDPAFFAGRCLRAGAHGFVYKQQDPEGLLDGVKAVLGGYRYFPDSAMAGLGTPGHDHDEARLVDSLSDRELTVLRYLALGYSNKQIADQFLINNKTVSSYKARLQAKVGELSVAGLTDFAKRNGLV